MPLYDVLRRFLSPLTRYRRYIDETLCPFIELPGVAVLGINTARSLTFKDGRVSEEQVEFIRETFARSRSGRDARAGHASSLFAMKVGDEIERAIGRQELALDAIEEAGVDLVLAGHNHHASSHDASELVDACRRDPGGPGRNGDFDAGSRAGAELQHHRHRRGPRHPDRERLGGETFKAADAQPYQFQDGRWKILKAEQPTH